MSRGLGDVYKRQINERPDVILNIVDGTNIERNLYLSTQLMELGIPVIMAVNMMDVVEKNGDKIHINIPARSIELLVDDETIAQRKAKGVNPPVRQLDGYLKRYAKLVTSSNTGAVFSD